MIAFGLRASISATGVDPRHDLAVDVRLAHTARDQLRVLRSEVDDENEIVVGQFAHRIGPVSRPMPTPCDRWSDLPSVCRAGATITSAFWNSFTVS